MPHLQRGTRANPRILPHASGVGKVACNYPLSRAAFWPTLTPLMADREFESVVERFYADLFRFGLSLARNEHDAGDLVQQTFVVYARKGAQIREGEKVRSWLFTTLYREFLRVRSRGERMVAMDDAVRDLVESAPAEAERHAERQDALEALQALEEGHRAVLTLFYLEGLAYKDIAFILNVPIGTVMSRLSRAKIALRKRLNPHEETGIDRAVADSG